MCIKHSAHIICALCSVNIPIFLALNAFFGHLKFNWKIRTNQKSYIIHFRRSSPSLSLFASPLYSSFIRKEILYFFSSGMVYGQILARSSWPSVSIPHIHHIHIGVTLLPILLLNLNMRRTQVKYNWNNLYHFYDFGHKVLSFSYLTWLVFVWNIICCLSKSCLVHFRLSALPSLRCCVVFDVIAAWVCALHANNFMHPLSAFLLEFAAIIRAIICFSILLTPIATLFLPLPLTRFPPPSIFTYHRRRLNSFARWKCAFMFTVH